MHDDQYKLRHPSRIHACQMLHHLSLGLLASAIAIAPLPTKAQDGIAGDPGDVMSMIQGMGEQLDECLYEDLAEERKLVAA
jgi:hypothetical protein